MRQLLRPVLMVSLVFPVTMLGQSKDTTGKPCPPVTAKTRQEALMMEQASNKIGCWVRDRNGKLVFVSELPPRENYKPMVGLIKIEWDGKEDCSAVDVHIFDPGVKEETPEGLRQLDDFKVGYHDGGNGYCYSYRQTGLHVPSGKYRVFVYYPGSGSWNVSGPTWRKEVTVSAGETVIVAPPRQAITVTGKRRGGLYSEPVNSIRWPRCGNTTFIGDCKSRFLSPGNYTILFSVQVPKRRNDIIPDIIEIKKKVTVPEGQIVTVPWPYEEALARRR